MKPLVAIMVAAIVLSACVATVPGGPAPVPQQRVHADPGPIQTPRQAVDNFVAVHDRMEPVIERTCRQRTRGANCDFRIGVVDDPTLPPNAFQTLDRSGRPVVAFTVALLADARNPDEIAFVMGHEAAHHIAGHIPRQQSNAQIGAALGAALGAAMGGGDQSVQIGQEIGGTYGARRYAKEFELEADALGTELTLRSGYDPERGAAFFNRIPDPGDRFLGTHPPNAERLATVRRTIRRLGGVPAS